MTRRRSTWCDAEADSISNTITATPDLTLYELKAKLATSLGHSTLCRALQVVRVTLKKALRAR